MTTFVLNRDNPESEEFEFFGHCYICAKVMEGAGQIKILRKIGDLYEPITTDRGDDMTFVGSGVLFNSFIECRKKLKHKIVWSGTGNVKVAIVEER